MKLLSTILLIVTATALGLALLSAIGIYGLYASQIPFSDLLHFSRPMNLGGLLPLGLGVLLLGVIVLGLREGGPMSRRLLIAAAIAAPALTALGAVQALRFYERFMEAIAHVALGAPYYAAWLFCIAAGLFASFLAQVFLRVHARALEAE